MMMNVSNLIVHQSQPLDDACVSTCLAMLLRVPAQQVIDDFHHQYVADEILPSGYLLDKGLPFRRYYVEERANLLPNRVYLTTVPSLNIEHGLHQILIVTGDFDERCMIQVFDPQLGNPDKNAYTEWPLNTWWQFDLSVKVQDLVAWREAQIYKAGA